jgi:GAF domain-containing protein
MPYLTCSSCGLRTYCVSEGACPACGTALRRTSPPVGPRPAPQLTAKLAMACRELRADAALLSQIRDGREYIKWAVGGDYANRSYPLDDTICARLLDGRIGALVTDVGAEPALAPLDSPFGAYLGVPFTGEDARLYVLCCLAHEVRPDLGDRDVRFLQGVAESLRPLLA